MKLFVTLLLAVCLSMVAAEITPRFPPTQPIIVTSELGSGDVTGTVLPCDYDYWRLESFTTLRTWNYLRVEFNQTGVLEGDLGSFFIVRSDYEDLEQELIDNVNIVDTLGELPGPQNYDYTCTGASCIIEITCDLQNGTYYIAIGGGQHAEIDYSFSVELGTVEEHLRELVDGFPVAVFEDQRPTEPPTARALHYAYWSIDIPESAFSEYTYLTVNISRVASPGLTMRLHYDRLPEAGVDIGVLDAEKEDCIYEYCVNTTQLAGDPFYDHPVNTQPRIPCVCQTFEQFIGVGIQLTCNLTVDPCHFQYGTWYISLELPARDAPFDPLDTTGTTDYTIAAFVEAPVVTTLSRNVTFKGFVEPERMTHYKLDIPRNQISEGRSHMVVTVSNVRGGYVDVFVHQGQGGNNNLAGGPESCGPANVTCTTRDACNIVVEKCHFSYGTWYIGVAVSYDEDERQFLVDDCDRLPITYTIRANWIEDAVPQRLVAGVPVQKYIGEALYDFYVIEVPPTIDTWLFVELYTKAEDSEVIISMLHGELPGGECYARPDFYCLTGDTRGLKIETGPPQEEVHDVLFRESCQFMIQTCELTPGPLFISVYGHHTGYAATGDNTYYQVPVHYTLWADFDVALAIHSSVSYSETVHERHYQHYYIRADNVDEGSWLSVELTNIQHGIPQTLEAFVNYNFLAGNCPCYDHLYNCTGTDADDSCGGAPGSFNEPEPNFLPDNNRHDGFVTDTFGVLPRNSDITHTCCTIVVPPCDFRSGVWYIGVLGVNEDLVKYTTPIGYTLTATIHNAPVVNPLIPGQVITDEVTQWNKTNEYIHYKVGAKALPDHDLVIKLTYVQNCEFLPKHDNLRDTLRMFVNRGGVAGGACYDYHCEAHIIGFSYCTIVVPSCEWTEDNYFVAIQGDFDAVFNGRYTIRATVEQVRDIQLTDSISVYNRVPEGRYQHYFIDVPALGDRYLLFDLYTNSDQDKVTAYLNVDDRAGIAPCFENIGSCETSTSCSWQVQACELDSARYYISVFGEYHQFYDVHVEYTLTAYLKGVVTPIGSGDPVTGHIKEGQIQHYRFVYETATDGEFLLFEIDNVQNGVVEVYYNFGDLAGHCPCYQHSKHCVADSSFTRGCTDNPDLTTTPNWCEIRVAPCELQVGSHYFSVVGIEQNTPAVNVYETPIGYTIELNVIRPAIIEPVVVRDRFPENELRFQFVANNRYNHYIVDVEEADWEEGFQVVVEITDVREGALLVFFNSEEPADESCAITSICNSNGLPAGGSCYWQIPFCLTKPGRYYISVEGLTGRLQASYDILIYLERPANVDENTLFTLDLPTNSLQFATNQEVNITHNKAHEPNGWVQFIELNNVATSDLEDGEILEIFFYRVINNAGEPLDFKVYLWPEKPAGAHDCCDHDLGSCQGAPCLRSVPLTTFNPGFIGAPATPGADPVYGAPGPHSDGNNNNLCSLGSGVGDDPSDGGSPFFGARCIARVWACDFNSHQNDTTANWWLTVIPASAPDAEATDLDGLSYSVQWRVRDTRIDPTTDAVGSVDLTPSINIQATPFTTQDFSITTNTTEEESFASFFLDHEIGANARRLVIQTEFTAGVGVVYIQKETFANPLDCNDYVCFSNEDCYQSDRFIDLQCCTTSTRYYITVRNTGAVGSTLTFRFRITSITEPDVEVISPAVPTRLAPYVATGDIPDADPLAVGVQGENYNFYRLDVTAESIANYRSLIINLTKNADDAEPLNIYVSYNTKAGTYIGDTVNSDKYSGPEGCHTNDWKSTVVGTEISVIQIPNCELLPGSYYISIFNPDFDFQDGQDDFRDYTLTVYYDDLVTTLALGTEYSTTIVNTVPIYNQLTFSVTAADIGYTTGSPNSLDYYVNYLRIQIGEVTTSDGTFNVYVNYDDVAGAATFGSCYNNFALDNADCGAAGCIFDIFPCPDEDEDEISFKLATGDYFVGIYGADISFTIRASIETEVYSQIVPTAVAGTGHRTGVSDNVFSVTAADADIVGNLDGYYRYYAEVSGSTESTYILANFSVGETTVGGTIPSLTMWRDDCARFECTVSSSEGWCTIDAYTLATCSARDGTYFFRVFNPDGFAFSITLYQNETVEQTIVDGQTITEMLYPYEYQQYVFSAASGVSTISVDIDTICGDVEVWISGVGPSGPLCYVDHCSTRDGEHECELFLDTCVVNSYDYLDGNDFYITVRGTAQTFPGQDSNSNLYLPIKYNLYVAQNFVDTIDASSSCFSVVDREPGIPNQMIFDLETIEAFGSLRFSMRIPTQLFDADDFNSNGFAALHVNFDAPVGFNSDSGPCFAQACIIADPDITCSFVIPACETTIGRYYIWADAPRGTEVLIEKYDPVTPIIVPEKIYPATINGPTPSGVDFDLPYRPNVQWYRIDVDPRKENFRLNVRVYDIQHGTLRVSVVDGLTPFESVGCGAPLPSTTADEETPFSYFVDRCETNGQPQPFWIKIEGTQQLCELHSIEYTLRVHEVAPFDDYRVDTEGCESVEEGESVFYRLNPRTSERPQDSILRFEIRDVRENEVVTLSLRDNNGELATPACSSPMQGSNTGFIYSLDASNTGDDSSSLIYDYPCGYDDLFFTITGTESDHADTENPTEINYYLSVTKQSIRINELINGETFVVDNDDEDACEHNFDYFFIEADDDSIDEFSWLQVTFESAFDGQIWVNKDHLGGELCYNSGSCSSTSQSGACNVDHICGFERGYYYVTVFSEGPYSLTATIITNSTELSLDQAEAGSVGFGEWNMYYIDLTKAEVPVGSRLAVEVSGVNGGQIDYFVSRNGQGAPYSITDDEDVCAIDHSSLISGTEGAGYDFIVVDSCELKSGRYYISVFGSNPDGARNCFPITYTLSVSVYNYNVTIEDASINFSSTGEIDIYSVDRSTETPIRYYKINPVHANSESFGQAVVANVTGGSVVLRVSNRLPVPETTWIAGTRRALAGSFLPGSSTPANGERPYTTQTVLDTSNGCYPGSVWSCSTDGDVGCNVWLSSCEWDDEDWYLSVEVVEQDFVNTPVTYDVVLKEYDNYKVIGRDTNIVATIPEGTWEYNFYAGQTPEQQSVRFRVQVLDGEGVYVTLRDHECPEKATWTRQIWCSGEFINEPWRCEIEIATRAEHPGQYFNTHFVSVEGSAVTYSIGYYVGRQNCHDFTGTGKREGLDFCQGLVPYSTWRYEDYSALDNSASCLFDQLYDHFRVSACWTGVTPECNDTLRRFACYENFRRCDADGFVVGTCRKACEAVVYECVNWFETVDLEAYNCTSARYVHDLEGAACTGHLENAGYETGRFLGLDPDEILYGESPVDNNAAGTLTAPFTLIFALVALIFLWKQ